MLCPLTRSNLVEKKLAHELTFDQDVFTRDFGTPDGDGGYEISPENLAVMTSMINVGELVGSLLAAPLNDLFGRKGALVTGAIVVVVGVVLQLSTTSSRALITAGRAVSGFGVGTFSVTSPLYMGVCLCPSVKPLLYVNLVLIIVQSVGDSAGGPEKSAPHVLAARPIGLADHRRRYQPEHYPQQHKLCIPVPHWLPVDISAHNLHWNRVATGITTLVAASWAT